MEDKLPQLTDNAELATQIMEETDVDKVKNLLQLFNLNQTKKNVLRADTMQNLMDKIVEQMSLRLDKRANEFTNEDLLKYHNSVRESIEKSLRSALTVDEINPITLNQQNNTQVNITVADKLSRDSRDKITNVIKNLLQNMQTESLNPVCEIQTDQIELEGDIDKNE